MSIKQCDMKTLKFKTNINCSGCIASVTPHLNAAQGITHWQVDTNNPEKILTVETETLDSEQIKTVVEKAGFKAQAVAA